MSKSPDAFRTISEVADWLGIQAHVLRFWESKFSQVKPVKRAGGRRYYRPADMQLIGGIKQLLYVDGLTIKGVQKIIREQGVSHVASLSPALSDTGETTDEPVAQTEVLEFRETPAADETPAVEDSVELTAEPVETDVQPQDHPAEDAGPITAPSAPEPAAVPPQEPAQEQLPLTSFAQNEVEATARDSDATKDEAPETVPEQPTADVVDAPDPPDEAALPYDPGPLANLGTLHSLNPRQAQEIRPIVQTLEDWLSRVSGAA